MKHFLLMIAVVALVGCGEKTTPAEPVTNAEPTPAEKAAAIKKAADEAQAKAFVNTLGMKFVPVPGTEVQFCIWETRVKDYKAYAEANTGVDNNWKRPIRNSPFTQTDMHPAVKVSFPDTQAFCAWLTKKEMAEGKIKAGQKYRLPTDAEWSVAVGLGKEKGNTPGEKNGGFDGVYPWGNEWPPPKGAGNYDPPFGGHEDGFKFTAPVGSFTANKIGLHDLGGNVWEWCEDKYIPITPKRVLRGASWADIAFMLSSERSNSHPNSREIYIGFLCVLVGGSGG